MDPLPAEGALPAAQGDQGAPRRAPAGGGGPPARTRARAGVRTVSAGRRSGDPAGDADHAHRANPAGRARGACRPPDAGVRAHAAGRRCRATTPSSCDAGGDPHHSRSELAAAAGLDEAQIRELESFGLIAAAREVDGVGQYDDDALEIARLSAGFFQRGVEARHLRMYRTFAEREAVLFGQVLMPYVRQRNPEARERLQEELVELSTLGRMLRTALLRGAVRETLAE